MGVRTTARKLAMQLLFQYDQQDFKGDIQNLIDLYVVKDKYQTATIDFVNEIVVNTINNITEIDNSLKENMTNWTIDRTAKVDLAILRIACYEIKYTKTEINIVINEAIEMAKKYSSEDSTKFLNGVLDKIKK